MFYFSAGQGVIEYPAQGWRTELHTGLDRPAIHRVLNGHANAGGWNPFLRIKSIPQRDFSADGPSLIKQRQRDAGMYVEAANEVGRVKTGLCPPQPLGCGIKVPVQRQPAEALVHGGDFNSGSVENGDQIACGGAL